MGARCLVKHNGNQLELQSDIVDDLTGQVLQADYVAVLCAVGEPCSAKTGILNAIIKKFQLQLGLTESHSSCDGFFQAKNSEDDDGQRIGGVLVSSPAFIFSDKLGRRAAVILLDVWNNFAECEHVYGKLMEFCFQVSSVKVFSLFGSLRQVTWWNGSFEGSDNFSPELKQMYSHLKTTLNQKQDQARKRNSESSSSVIAVKTSWKDEAEYFPVGIQADEAAVSLNKDCLIFILKQVCSLSNNDGVCKPSELKNHFSNFVTRINNIASQPHHSIQNIAVNTENAVTSRQIFQAYKKRLRQVYSESSQMFLTFQELNEYSVGFVTELGNDQDEVKMTCDPHYQHLKRFHNHVESSVRLTETEIVKNLRETLSFYEKIFISCFKKQLEQYRIRQDMEHIKSNFTATVERTTVKVLTALHSSNFPLKDEVEILTAKLKHEIGQKLSQDLETLQNQIELIIRTFKVFKYELAGRIHSSICFSGGGFEEAAECAWKAMEASERGLIIQSLFIRVRDESAQEYEDQLRQQNNQILKSELCLTKQATNIAADYVLGLLTEYLKKFGVLTETEVMRAFQVASKLAKEAFLSAPGFNYSPPWQEAFQSLQSTLEDRYNEVRQINLNATRRWDRALESALRSSAEFYSQQMDQRLPKHKISREELESTHQTWASQAVSRFTVASEVNDPTKMYWKKLLVKNQLQEWKEGYVRVNETKKAAEESRMTSNHAKRYIGEAGKTQFSEVIKKARFSEYRSNMTARKTPPQSQSLNSTPSHVGVYFGPEIVIFTALLPDGDSVQLPISPFATCSNNKISWGKEALQVARNTELLFNIFSILTEPAVPIDQPCTVEFNGESVCLTAETLAVLFFKHIVSQITVQTGQQIRSCAVALPGLLSRGAKTAVKEALRLAGFSEITLVPFTTAQALSVAPYLQFERTKNLKKIVTIYHAGKYLEAALLHGYRQKLEVKQLFGSLNLLEVPASDLQSHTQKIVEKVGAADLFATVTLVGDESMSAVKDGLNKAVTEMGSWKPWCLRFGSRQNGIKLATDPGEVSLTLAKLDASTSDSATAKSEVRFPGFDYFQPYNFELQRNGIRSSCSSGKPYIYQYTHTTGTSGFRFDEGDISNSWNYIFDVNPQTPSGPACSLAFFPDGSFRIRPPPHTTSIPVHSSSCKLFTSWDQESVEQNVERVVKLMARKDAETNVRVEMKKQEATEVPKTEGSIKFRLNQLVRQVEDGLKNSGLNQGPVFDFIHDSLQECRQVLQNPMSTDQSMNVAMRKLEIRSSNLVEK